MRERFHQLSALEGAEQERARKILRARGALSETPPPRRAALLCGCPVDEAAYALELCTHPPNAEHNAQCVQWCRRCSEGAR